MVVCAVAMWVVGLGGGLWLSRGLAGAPPVLAGALGFWVAGTAGLLLASVGMAWLLRRVWRRGA
jgi:MATE family multidrug resistance protein